MLKTCKRCGVESDISNFYVHGRMKDGHLSFCKECTKARVNARYNREREKVAEYERKRHKEPHRKEQNKECARRRKIRHPEKSAAYTAVARAIRNGELVRGPCERCGTTVNVQAHHHDYFKPLDVQWLCFKCHREHGHGQVVICQN